jgi:hypothetical protein
VAAKTPAVGPQPEAGPGKLAQTVRSTVGSFLGTGFPSSVFLPKTELSPLVTGVFAAALYALIPMLQMACKPTSLELIFLSCWGAVYFGLVVALTRRTSLAIVEIIEALLIPSLSEDCADSAREYIEKNFVRPRIFMKSLGAASIAMLISCVLLPRSHGVELVIWAIGFFILYFTASQATLTAPFYTCFSQSLKAHDDVLFPIDPAASPSIIAFAALAKRVLFSGFWFLF